MTRAVLPHPLAAGLALCCFAVLLAGGARAQTPPAQPLPPPAPGTVPPAEGEDPSGLYVIVEATQRPLDAILVLPPACGVARSACDTAEAVLGNDARLSGVLRWLKSTSGLVSQVVKSPLPNLALRHQAAQAAGATWILASQLKPAKTPGLVELNVRLIDARDGKGVELGDWGRQEAPAETVRAMAHRAMNGVYGALTGIVGSFDSVIFYSAPGPGCGRCIWQVDADGFNRRVIVGDKGIHMFPIQLVDGGLAYTSFRGDDAPSLFRLDLAQLFAIAELTPTVPKGKGKRPPAKAAPQPGEPPVVPRPFAAGNEDLQFRGCAQHPRGEIVATINDGDQADIWLLDHTGTPTRNLTRHESDDLGPSFAPDGAHVAFVSDRTGSPQVYVMEADGGNARRMTFAGPYNTDPDWGPDGKIAYSGMRGNAIDILTVDLNGRMQRLTPGQGRRSLEPSWSPDGRRLVYVSNEDGRGSRLWVTSHDGAAREPLDVPFGHYYTPSWQRIAGRLPKRFSVPGSPGGAP